MQTNNKLREALENSNGLLEELAAIGEWGESAREQIAENNAALSKPPRNCDVGSEEEQSRRYEAFCEAHHMQCDKGCSACPCSKKSGVSCELYWAQMPYEAERKEEVDGRKKDLQ